MGIRCLRRHEGKLSDHNERATGYRNEELPRNVLFLLLQNAVAEGAVREFTHTHSIQVVFTIHVCHTRVNQRPPVVAAEGNLPWRIMDNFGSDAAPTGQ